MKSQLLSDGYPRQPDPDLHSPLAQPGIMWLESAAVDLSPQLGNYSIRFSDPGGILRLVSDVVGPPTAVCILADNLVGAASWSQISFAQEYEAVTRGAGAFVCGAMKYLSVSGPDAGRLLDVLTPKDMLSLPVGRAAFVLFTTPAGTVDTEAVVVRTPDEYLISLGGSARDPGWLAEALALHPGANVTEPDISSFNIKGPGRFAAMQRLLHADDRDQVAQLRPFHAVRVRTNGGQPVWVLRTKIGMEMWAGAEPMHETWCAMLDQPEVFTPCGWNMVNTFRVECDAMVFGLCPLDMHSGTTLWEVGYDRMVATDKRRDYIGRAALQKNHSRRRLWLAGLEPRDSSAPAPAVGAEIVTVAGEFAGHVTTAAFSPRHGRPLAFAHLKPTVRAGDLLALDCAKWVVRTLPFNREPTGESADVQQLANRESRHALSDLEATP